MSLYQYCVLSEEEVVGADSPSPGGKEDYLYQVSANDKSQYSYSAMSASEENSNPYSHDSDEFVIPARDAITVTTRRSFISTSGSNLLISSPGRAALVSRESTSKTTVTTTTSLKRFESSGVKPKMAVLDSYACMDSSSHDETSVTDESADEAEKPETTPSRTTTSDENSREALDVANNMSSSGSFKKDPILSGGEGGESPLTSPRPNDSKDVGGYSDDNTTPRCSSDESPRLPEVASGSNSRRGSHGRPGRHHHHHHHGDRGSGGSSSGGSSGGSGGGGESARSSSGPRSSSQLAGDESLPSPSFRTKLQSSAAKFSDVTVRSPGRNHSAGKLNTNRRSKAKGNNTNSASSGLSGSHHNPKILLESSGETRTVLNSGGSDSTESSDRKSRPQRTLSISKMALTAQAGLSVSAGRAELSERAGEGAKRWNEELYGMLGLPASQQKYEGISTFVSDFTYAATLYSQVIISELYTPFEQKTVQPQNIGGVAGGAKYIVQGILFKFALDFNGMYGSDENAMKVAGHEWRGLNCYYCANIVDIILPLMCLVDYRGFRIVAMSVLPINKKSLIYGSDDAGRTVLDKNAQFSRMMRKAAKHINIKGHACGPNKQMIHGPTDIEGHMVGDKFYLIDYARTLPPQLRLSIHKEDKVPRHLFEMLRPELVRSNAVPLNSDAFSKFLQWDPDRVESLKEISAATKRLIQEEIPKVQRYLKENEHMHNEFDLPSILHSFGINLRFLGYVRKGLPARYPKIGAVLLDEMVARVMKNYIKLRMRLLMQRVKIPVEEPYKHEVLTFLNSVFVQGPDKQIYWRHSVKQELTRKFICPLTDAEMQPEFELINVVDVARVLQRFQEMTGIEINKSTPLSLLSTGKFKLVNSDIERFGGKVKPPAILYQAQATLLYYLLPEVVGTEVHRLYAKAKNKFALATNQNPSNANIYLLWGSMLLHCSERNEFIAHPELQLILYQTLSKLQLAFALSQTSDNDICQQSSFKIALSIINLVANGKGRCDVKLMLTFASQYISYAFPSNARSSVQLSATSSGGICVNSNITSHHALHLSPSTVPSSQSSSTQANHHNLTQTQTQANLQQPIPTTVSSKLKKVLLTQFMDFVETRSVRVLFALLIVTTEYRQLRKLLHKRIKSLDTIDLSDFSGFDVEYLPSFLRQCGSVKSFTLGHVTMTQTNFNEIVEALPQCTTYKFIRLDIELNRKLRFERKTLAKVQRLEFIACDGIDDCTIDSVTKHCRELNFLSVVGCTKVTLHALSLTNVLERLTNLSFGSMRRDALPAPLFMSAHQLVLNPNIYVVNPNEPVVDDTILTCSALTKKATFPKMLFNNLKRVNLSGFVDLPDNLVVEIIACSESLISLDLRGCSALTDTTLNALKSCEGLEYLYLAGMPKVTKAGLACVAECKALSVLHICDCATQDYTAGSVFKLMSSLDELKELVLTGFDPCREVIDRDFLPWGEVAVPVSSHPHPLRVYPSKDPYNPLKEREALHQLGLGSDDDIVVDHREEISSTHLKSLGLDFLVEGVCSMCDKSFRSFSFKWVCEFCAGPNPTTTPMFALCEICALQENRKLPRKQTSFNALSGGQLTTLNLSGWRSLTDFAVISICRQNTNLKIINLDGCKNLTDLSLLALESQLNLSELSLSGTNFSERGLIDLVQSTINIIELNLNSCEEISDDLCNSISQHLSRIEIISMASCPSITFLGVQDIILHANCLQEFNLLHNPNITEQHIALVRHASPLLSIRYTPTKSGKNQTIQAEKNMRLETSNMLKDFVDKSRVIASAIQAAQLQEMAQLRNQQTSSEEGSTGSGGGTNSNSSNAGSLRKDIAREIRNNNAAHSANSGAKNARRAKESLTGSAAVSGVAQNCKKTESLPPFTQSANPASNYGSHGKSSKKDKECTSPKRDDCSGKSDLSQTS